MNSHLKAAKDFRDFQASIPSEAPHAIVDDVVVHAGEKRRRAASAREAARRLNADEQNQLPSCKLKRQFKGASNHLEYQETVKEAATIVALKFQSSKQISDDSAVSFNTVLREMQVDLAAKGIEICKTTCRTHVKNALNNDGIGLSPQKPGGVSLPSHIEKKIAAVVRRLRERKFPVFASEVMRWAADEIAGTEYAIFFPDGKPSEGW